MGIRFKIANWIMGDYLRNYLAVGVRLPISNLIKYSKIYNLPLDVIAELKQMLNTIDEIFEM